VVPNGSSGTHAGLAAGFSALGISSQLVKSFAVLSPAAEARHPTLKKARATASLVGAGQIGEGDIEWESSVAKDTVFRQRQCWQLYV
jgi:hypothetical protein